jgi:hypothetical protein
MKKIFALFLILLITLTGCVGLSPDGPEVLTLGENSYKTGVINRDDMNTLISLTKRLFEHLYSKYSEYKEVDNMLHDESLDLEIDKYIDAVDDLKEELAKKEAPIDFIFVNNMASDVKSYTVDTTEYNGIFASDHHPVISQMTLINA